ncbi:CHAT domain-containing protein [Streptomyces sp. MB09-02B]|uniref:CHAT domain-containing protein n=1 Tax=Streptomyces sp. MB09-02B TaxID=3028667 RepID=UPI0029A3FE6E|nr:CHAT domain-containing protein [Streptomyces sp. MB09-02B]MDX3642918.1 CHAT domain-containing protein [Streptomyces sp. MB09-02B]
MSGGEPQRGPRWLTGAGNAIRRVPSAGPRAAVRREAPSLLHLLRPQGPPSGTGMVDARPHERLEDGCAVLRVTRAAAVDGQDGYRFHGRCGDLACSSGATALMAPSIGLGNATEAGEFPSEILRCTKLWSGNQRELGGWINQVRARYGDRLRLIVWDDTGLELPWEMFWVPADDRLGLTGGLLGAVLRLARWMTVHDGRQGLPEQTEECHGGILAYLHDDMVDDGLLFKPYVHQTHPRMTPFLRALDTVEERTGLVYMGCHGTYGDAVTRLTLAGRTWAEYDSQTMHVLRTHGSMVCLNACHSGRFVHNRAQGEHALRGFAELFLRKGAGGCIVTAGRVGDLEARVLIRRLMREVTDHPELPVTETLRAFRARAVKDFGTLAAIPTTRNDEGHVDMVGQKRVLRLLYAFMFHYYGHPLTALRLVSEKGNNVWGGGPW